MPTVEYRSLGKTGLKVSVPILGGALFGSPKWDPSTLDEEPSIEIMKAAWDLGINTFDTSNNYSNGESERHIGKFIKKYNIPRHQIVIATKCLLVVGHDPSIRARFVPGIDQLPEYVNQSGLSRAAIFNAVDASLARLQTSYIDLLHIHRFDPSVTPEETMKALHDLVQSGKVRYMGASSMRCWQFAMLNETAAKNGWTKFVSMHDEYSLLYREEEREMHAYCKYNGIGIIPWYPMASGVLARPVGTETPRTNSAKGTPLEFKLIGGDTTIINRVEELAKKKNCKMSQIALAWVGSKVTSPIVGINSVRRLQECIVKGIELTSEEMAYLEEPYEPKVIRNHL
ncbi:Aldo/keto reductase [Rhizopogon vinicolor AM-OR11-026]|uniref:Aldo/keto reductase n=1 Tax=Rhizopogon vinicolor AM-OR11-026 TaxID=1314800 RepID=A0A1B7MK60_9AGAM|nr:Aldo/keto reductase [Rhizopogon vinicolor AM-OR11-026]